MANYASNEIIKILKKKKLRPKSKILILGYTFKENCSDYRNTQIEKITNNLQKFSSNIEIFDPYINKQIRYNMLTKFPSKNKIYDCIIIAVPHKKLLEKESYIKNLGKKNCLYFDLKLKMKTIKSEWNL